MEKKKIVFIVNPISGTQSKKTILGLVEELIDRSKYEFDIVPTQYAGHATEIAARAASEGVFIVVAIGGDGTINEIGQALVHTDTALGIIPCGSGNGLARHLMIPMEARKAIEVINEGNIGLIDYGHINNRPFFCTCGVGFDAFVSLKFSTSGHRGLLSYLENTLHESITYQPETYELRIDNAEETKTYRAFLIACGNAAQYGNNAYITPQASIDDGWLDITIIKPFTMFDAPMLSFQLFNKNIDQNNRIETFRCKKLHIHRKREGVMHVDGDPTIEGKDLNIEIIPLALHVVKNIQEKKYSLPESTLQIFADYFHEIQSVRGDLLARNKQLIRINRRLLRKITKL